MDSHILQRALGGEGYGGDSKEMDLLGRTAANKLLERFSSYLVDELGRSPNTAQGYVWYIQRASKSLNKPAHKINADDLRRFLRETDYALETKRGVIVAFHQFHDYGVTDGLWKRNGISTLKTPKVKREPKAPLRVYDAHLLLAHALSPVQARVCYLGLYAGLRIKELAGLREEHWQGDTLVITPEIAKAQKKRKVPVHPELQRQREHILGHSPSKGTCGQMFTVLRCRLGITDLENKPATSHTLRRTFASTMYDAGVPWEVVAKVLGHGIDVTAMYAKIGEDTMREGVEKVHYWDGVPTQLSMF